MIHSIVFIYEKLDNLYSVSLLRFTGVAFIICNSELQRPIFVGEKYSVQYGRMQYFCLTKLSKALTAVIVFGQG